MILLVGLTILAQTVWTQGTNQAGLVIIHGDGHMVGRCVEFSEPQITGYDLLQRSALDLNIEVSGMGATICRIDEEGCTYPAQSSAPPQALQDKIKAKRPDWKGFK